jgi:hypothetical protein
MTGAAPQPQDGAEHPPPQPLSQDDDLLWLAHLALSLSSKLTRGHGSQEPAPPHPLEQEEQESFLWNKEPLNNGVPQVGAALQV